MTNNTPKNQSDQILIGIIGLLIAAIACLAGIMVVPEARSFLGLGNSNNGVTENPVATMTQPSQQEEGISPTATHQEAQTETTPIPSSDTPLLMGETVSKESLARLIGGSSEYWTKRGPVVWGYWDKGNNVSFRHPGENMVMTYWAGFSDPQNAGSCHIVVVEDEKYIKCSEPGATFTADGVGLHLIDYTGLFR